MCIEKLGPKMVAESDITCWKFGTIDKDGKTFESLVYRFKYEFGKPYKSNIVIKDGEGFEGFHTIKDEKNILKFVSLQVVKCVIPKGSVYYLGSYVNLNEDIIENYISEDLIVVEKRNK